MAKKQNKQEAEQKKTLQEEQSVEQETPKQEAEEPSLEQQMAALQEKLDKKENDYLLLMAEFDNFRRRTLREKQELIKNANERAMSELLPVIDDFERALAAMQQGGDKAALAEGVQLIYHKFVKYLEQQQVKPIESTGKEFDPELHDALTMCPAPDESLRGKVVDTTTKGYMINDKVLRHAKVVVGQ